MRLGDEGWGRAEGNQPEREREKRTERVTAVEVRAGPFTARTRKTNRRGERGSPGQGAFGRPRSVTTPRYNLVYGAGAFCDYHRAAVVYFRSVYISFYSPLIHVSRLRRNSSRRGEWLYPRAQRIKVSRAILHAPSSLYSLDTRIRFAKADALRASFTSAATGPARSRAV